MMRDIVSIRPAQPEDAQDLARVRIDAWRSAYRGLVPDEYLASMNYQAETERWEQQLGDPVRRRNIFAAEMRDHAVGFAVCGPVRPDSIAGVVCKGELYAIYLLPVYQGMGIGRQLVRQCAQDLVDRGLQDMVLWVLKDNHPACGFYQRLGGILAGEKSIEIGEKTLLEVAYIWSDLNVLLEK